MTAWFGYTGRAAQKKCSRDWRPAEASATQAADTPAVSAACSFVPLFGGSGREPQGSPVPAGASRYANLFEPPPLIGV